MTAWHDFIIETATEAAKLGGYEVPFWVTTGLSDPPVLVGQGDGGAGGGGAGGATSKPAGAGHGEACDSANACQADLVCFAAGSGTTGTCAAVCHVTSECDDGLACIDAGSVSVCSLPTRSADDSSGCNVATTGAPSSLAGALLGVLGAALALLRRRR